MEELEELERKHDFSIYNKLKEITYTLRKTIKLIFRHENIIKLQKHIDTGTSIRKSEV